jgi:hypothetical protein
MKLPYKFLFLCAAERYFMMGANVLLGRDLAWVTGNIPIRRFDWGLTLGIGLL